jgi:ribosomal protein L15
MRGFSNYKFRRDYAEVTVRKLHALINEGIEEIDLQLLIDRKIVRAGTKKIKCIGKCDILRSVVVRADFFSVGAAACICANGGEAIITGESEVQPHTNNIDKINQ